MIANKKKSEIMMVAAIMIAVALVGVTMTGDHESDADSTKYVKFVTKVSESTGDGVTASSPIEIGMVSGNGLATTTASSGMDRINEGDILVVVGVEDVAITFGDDAPRGKYVLSKNVTIVADDNVHDVVWNVTIGVADGKDVILSNFTFGEVFIFGNAETTIQKSSFVINENSVNYTENGGIGGTKTVSNLRGGSGMDLTANDCDFRCITTPNGVEKTYAVYSQTNSIVLKNCTIDGYNRAVNIAYNTNVVIENNEFSNIKPQGDGTSGCVVLLGLNHNDSVNISNNVVTSPIGSNASFIKINVDYSVDAEKTSVVKNSIIGLSTGVEYVVKNNASSSAPLVVDGNLFSADGITATEMVVNPGMNSESIVIQTNIVPTVPESDPEPDVPVIPDDDDELPFIPPQSNDDGADTTTYVAVAAAAAVVAILAVLAVGISKGKL